MMQIIETEFNITDITDTIEDFPQAPTYFQKTIFQMRKAISNNLSLNEFLLKSE